MASDWRAASLIALCATFIAIQVIVVAVRVYARRHQKAKLVADDWLMLPALASALGAAACTFYSVDVLKVLGYSSREMSKVQAGKVAESKSKTNVAINLLTILCMGCIKASALFFYKRIFCVSGRKAILNIIIVTSIVVVFAWMVTFEFLIGFQCSTHLSALWDGTKTKYCTYSWPALIGGAISDFLLDVWVVVLPIYPISRLQTTMSRKLAICGIFLLACVGVGASIARVVIFIQINNAGKARFNIDPAKGLSQTAFYMMLEVGVSLVAVNLPSIWLVFASVAPDAILRSIRSVVSLASLRSKDSAGSKDPRHLSNAEYLKSSTSNSSIVPMAGSSAEAVACELHRLEEHHLADVPSGRIHISRSVKQTSGSLPHEPV